LPRIRLPCRTCRKSQDSPPCFQRFLRHQFTAPSPTRTLLLVGLVVKDFPGNLALIRLVLGICMNSYRTQLNHVALSLTCTGRAATNHARAGHVLHVSYPFVLIRSVKPTLAQPHRDTADTAHLCQPKQLIMSRVWRALRSPLAWLPRFALSASHADRERPRHPVRESTLTLSAPFTYWEHAIRSPKPKNSANHPPAKINLQST
jgi:hypothetical protein